MKTLTILFTLLVGFPLFAQVGGNYSPSMPANCSENDYQNVHQMRAFLVENSTEEFVVHLTSRVGVCFNGRFAPQPLIYDYETTFIPERFFWREPFDADFTYTEGQRSGEIVMRFQKAKLFKKHHLQQMDFYFGVHGKGHRPIYFKWYVTVMQLPDGNVKLSTKYQGSRNDIQ